jgi:DDE superfamily endonuclease
MDGARSLDALVLLMESPSRFRNRSEDLLQTHLPTITENAFFVLSVQSMCDSRYCSTFASAICSGSTQDSTAFEMSLLSGLLHSKNGLPSGYWVAADDAYICGERIIAPWPGRNMSKEKDALNYWKSSARILIEQAFGMPVARWGVLWRPLRVPIGKYGQAVIVCMKLQNNIIERAESSLQHVAAGLTIPEPSTLDVRSHSDRPDMSVRLQNNLDTDESMHRRHRDLEASETRTAFTRAIKTPATEDRNFINLGGQKMGFVEKGTPRGDALFTPWSGGRDCRAAYR